MYACTNYPRSKQLFQEIGALLLQQFELTLRMPHKIHNKRHKQEK